MNPLRQALGAAYPLPAMDPDTVRSISAGLARIERKEGSERIAAPMRELFDMLAQGEVFELDGVSVMHMPVMGGEREACKQACEGLRGTVSMFATSKDCRLHNNAITCCVQAIRARGDA